MGHNQPECYHCKSKNVRIVKIKRDALIYTCKNKKCAVNQFSVFHGTDLQSNNLKVGSWLIVSDEYNRGEYGCSNKALASKIGVEAPTISKMYNRLEKLNQQNVNLFGSYNPKITERKRTNAHRKIDTKKSIERSSKQLCPSQNLIVTKANHNGTVKKMGEIIQKSGRRKLSLEPDRFKMIYNTNEKAMKLLIEMRWGKHVECPDCHSRKISKYKSKGREYFRCLNKRCGRDKFNVFTDSPFKHNKLGARKVLYAIYDLLLYEAAISAKDFQRRYGYVYLTCWFTCHRIRRMMQMLNCKKVMSAVEYDTTFPYGYNHSKRKRARKNITANPILHGAYSVDEDVIYLGVSWDTYGVVEGSKFLTSVVAPNSQKHLFGDSAPENLALKKHGWNVEVVNHKDKQYGRRSMFNVTFKGYKINRNLVTTNHLEKCWGLINNNIKGIHKHVGAGYVILYASEAAFKLSKGNVGIDIAYRIENLMKNGCKNGHISRKELCSHFRAPPPKPDNP